MAEAQYCTDSGVAVVL